MKPRFFTSINGAPQGVARRAQAGAAAIELALVIIVMLLMVAGTIGFGRAIWYADALTKATRDGARLLASWPSASIGSAGLGTAGTISMNTANAANLSPQLTLDNVVVECLNDSFAAVACSDGTAPANVRVSIVNFSVSLTAWFPFIGNDGVINYDAVGLAPHTTMRYMN